jgi:hypothetical protein
MFARPRLQLLVLWLLGLRGQLWGWGGLLALRRFLRHAERKFSALLLSELAVLWPAGSQIHVKKAVEVLISLWVCFVFAILMVLSATTEHG